MYGFHKKVGLSDNSMRSSENKMKTPSEYYHEYFRRGRPDLLWLIQKPKNAGPRHKRGREDEEDNKRLALSGADRVPWSLTQDQGGGGGLEQDMVALPKAEIANVRREIANVQRNQAYITNMINQLRQQNAQFYQQASAFQSLHERHENSINAILTFLATFYNRSLEGHGAQNLANLFTESIPQKNQQHGNVVDVGDEGDNGSSIASPPQQPKPVRRPLAILPAPANQPVADETRTRQHASEPPPTNITDRKQGSKSSQTSRPASVTSSKPSPPTKEDASNLELKPMTPDNEGIMSVIQSANATSSNGYVGQSSKFDLNSALEHYESNGNGLTPEQRNNMLKLMMGNSDVKDAGRDNVLINPNAPPVPSVDQFTATQDQLDMLQRLQEDQNQKLRDLEDRLQPLSPTGSIAGLQNGQYFSSNPSGGGNPGDFDLDKFINSEDYFPDGQDLNFDNTTPGAFDFDFDDIKGYDGAKNEGDGGDPNYGRIQSIDSSEATSPAATNAAEDPFEEMGSEPKKCKIG